jgi:hypothetical protein
MSRLGCFSRIAQTGASQAAAVAEVKRDGFWIEAPAADLVRSDVVQISLGEVPVEIDAGSTTYAAVWFASAK